MDDVYVLSPLQVLLLTAKNDGSTCSPTSPRTVVFVIAAQPLGAAIRVGNEPVVGDCHNSHDSESTNLEIATLRIPRSTGKGPVACRCDAISACSTSNLAMDVWLAHYIA
jgi:hypothetical protein